jgi:hypothetical protein
MLVAFTKTSSIGCKWLISLVSWPLLADDILGVLRIQKQQGIRTLFVFSQAACLIMVGPPACLQTGKSFTCRAGKLCNHTLGTRVKVQKSGQVNMRAPHLKLKS